MAEDRSDHGSKNADRDRDNTYNGDIEEEEPDFSDPEGFVDDVTDEDLLGDILKNKPHETDGIDSIIVVDNIPQVGDDRVEKLQNVIRKIFSKFGKILNEHYPQDNGTTKGYCFFEYNSPEHAQEAVKQANGCKLDKQHTFLVNLFSDFDRYTNVPDEWVAPEPQPYTPLGNLRHWLLEADCIDQFSVIYDAGERTAIYGNSSQEPLLLEERANWTETFVCWSTQGTYLATFHSKGIALWGGEIFQQIMRFSHQGVQLIDFSPCERYLVTFSPLMDSREEPQAIIVWDILTGQKKRGFRCENQSTWPILKWSYDGSYFARHGEDIISVYETPSFGLLDKKSLKVPGMRDFTWSPADHYIAYWVGEQENVPCRVVLIQIPSRIELCVRNLFNVADCKMHWQKQGDYLCVKVDRYTKAKKIEERDKWKYSGITYNFELFRIREKQIPVDKVECKESVVAFAWEPNGSRFAFIHGESPRISVSFYEIRTGGKVILIKTIEKRQANHLFWCPSGQFIVVAGLRSMNGILEFIDTSDVTVMAQTEHFMAMDVEWDPTGRYVTTAVSWWGHKMDNAYWIWNFQGKILKKMAPDRFCQFLWRPRPPTLLSQEQVKEVKKTFKKYAAQFEMKDKISQSTASKELIEKRRALRADYLTYRDKKEEEFLHYKDRRLALRDDIDTDELDSHLENMEEEETIEFLLKVEETIIDEE